MKIKILNTVKKPSASILNNIALWISIWLISVAVIWLIVLLVISPQIANAIAATATLTLAFAAFWAIWQENLATRELPLYSQWSSGLCLRSPFANR